MAVENENIVSEKFWLNLAAENIYNSFEKRVASVTRLKEVIVWAFTLFTTGGFVIGVFGKVSEFPYYSLYLFGAGFALLTLAYVLAGEAQYPVTQQYHPNDTEGIARVFSAAVNKQSAFFKLAAGITFLGFLAIAFAILFLFSDAKKPVTVVKSEMYPLTVITSLQKKDSLYAIPLTVMTLPKAEVYVSIRAGKEKEKLLFNEVYKADTTGRLYQSFTVSEDSELYWIKAGIRPVNKTDTIIETSKTIRLEKPKTN